jgi:hypothetical protein
MRVKLTVICLLVLAAPLAWWPRLASSQSDSSIITLNVRGVRERGPVRFDHQAHLGRLNPDPQAPFKASAAASCSGCHHTTNEQGFPQLWKCTVCHQTEGKGTGQYTNQRCGQQCEPTGNPKNCACDELYYERAFHDSCIGCHRATNLATKVNRAPATCSGCHAARQL